MKKEEVGQIFDSVAVGKFGEEFILNFRTEKEAEVARVQLHKEKGEFTKKRNVKFSISVQRKYNTVAQTYRVILTKLSNEFEFYKIDAGGNKIMIPLENEEYYALPTTPNSEQTEEEEMKEVISKMRKEGWTDEQIEVYMQEESETYGEWTEFRWREAEG